MAPSYLFVMRDILFSVLGLCIPIRELILITRLQFYMFRSCTLDLRLVLFLFCFIELGLAILLGIDRDVLSIAFDLFIVICWT